MDLRLYLRVIWRFRIIVLAGLILAVILSFISYFSVSFKGGTPSITHRQSETWQSQEALFLDTKGGPIFSPYSAQLAGGLSQLGIAYSELANSDPVRALILKSGPINGTVSAKPVVDPVVGRVPLPFVNINATASDPATAASIARRAGDAFISYINQQVAQHKVPQSERVRISISQRASALTATLLQGRRKTVPIVILLTTLIATLGLVFILENLRPRVAPVRIRDEDLDVRESVGRGA